MVVHAGGAGAMVPAFDGLGFGTNGLLQCLAEGFGDLDLAERRRADQFVSGTGMAGVGQHDGRGVRNIIEVDKTEPGFDRIGDAIDAVLTMRSHSARQFCM